jgi:L-alanine-DL-glutamate epimerase-like enolase superfamily enzyme
MLGEIQAIDVVMIGIDLPSPFPLGFGKLKTLPRVFIRLLIEDNKRKLYGFGEASIDFPFSHYDAWDVYHALSGLQLKGLNILNRLDILKENQNQLSEFPAAFAALNMALDDAYGRLLNVPVVDLYESSRSGGTILESVPFLPVEELVIRMKSISSAGRVPKVKAGESVLSDIERLAVAFDLGIQFAVDFNAAYSFPDFSTLVDRLSARIDLVQSSLSIFWEQPSKEHLGIGGLAEVKEILNSYGYSIPLVADESFVTKEDALRCEQSGVLLNYKIQKIGGIWLAQKIEKSLQLNFPAMVGGTFPTAVGRVWDQQAASILRTTTLPSDGWQPATDWFSGDKHFIAQDFLTKSGTSTAFSGAGLGVTVLWDNILKFQIADPQSEYRALRQNESGIALKIELVEHAQYSNEYTRLSGKHPLWNL